MKPRTFLVDITVSFPKGKGTEDWSYVGHLMEDLEENNLPMTSMLMTSKVMGLVTKWIKEHPSTHDCFDNSIERDGQYVCAVDGKDTSEAHRRKLKLIGERAVNARATDIVG